MGRTSKWFRNLLGGKKDPKQASPDPLSNTKEKRRWSFGKSSKDRENKATYRENNYMCDSDNEQNMHAVAVAAATAAAADAAVAAAEAAVAVVRLTSNGRLSNYLSRERKAAVKIQTAFRGYLARRALRALKGLVKLQALVRGYLVRKQADATLYRMHSLLQIQARVRARRIWMSEEAKLIQWQQKHRRKQELCPRKSTEGWNAAIDHGSYTQSRRGFGYAFPQQEMEINLDESAKIVEIDTFKPKVNSRRRYSSNTDSVSADPSISSTVGRYSMPNYPFQSSSSHIEGSFATQNVFPVPGCFSTRLSIPSTISDELSASALQELGPIDLNGDWTYSGEDYKFSTAKSSPQFCYSSAKYGMTSTGLSTPSKTEYSNSYSQGYSAFPSYMGNTESSRAKVRSHSVPKQRLDSSEKTPSSIKKRMSLQEAVENRLSFSSVRTQRSCSYAQEACKENQNAGPGRLDRSTMSFRDTESNRFHSKW
ncbi:hypothetical protein SUGI_0603850 [Cryptomeria japonica]|uniref:protein IQ-DOMAIN 23 n=1 Tax=Cryptomeria japonica TaxID=3369 RepID=UPI002414BDA4|nr:protein IQ-DOMAIN 23 [Cryptomeria japonica]GLJ30506.1 hypothetical protein SUGI_0603850 [Cryptomeria japonica]